MWNGEEILSGSTEVNGRSPISRILAYSTTAVSPDHILSVYILLIELRYIWAKFQNLDLNIQQCQMQILH